MARNPLQNVRADISIGPDTAIKAATSNANGMASAVFTLTRAQYEAARSNGQLYVRGSKEGYLDNTKVHELPSYEAAVANGIEVAAVMEKRLTIPAYAGRVVDSVTRAPIAGATVGVYKIDDNGVETVYNSGTTDSDGNYFIAVNISEQEWPYTSYLVRSGRMVLRYSAGGYISAEAVDDNYWGYATVSGNTINMSEAVLASVPASLFYLDPNSVTFGKAGGTRDVTVHCDEEWEAGVQLAGGRGDEFIPLPYETENFRVTKLNSTTIRVVGKPNTTTSSWGKGIAVRRPRLWGDDVVANWRGVIWLDLTLSKNP